ncbi:hypothetical protein H6G91_32545 [Nostoc muscorum FACHB-395]|nr:hypothetical protein [Desmonostoc muscorum FACHB-395]
MLSTRWLVVAQQAHCLSSDRFWRTAGEGHLLFVISLPAHTPIFCFIFDLPLSRINIVII